MLRHTARIVPLFLLTALAPAQDLATVQGRVIDSVAKQPIAGARVVSLRRAAGVGYSTKTFEAEARESPQPPDTITFVNITGDDGKFSFQTTAPATFRIFTRRKGYVDAGMSFETVKSIEVKPGESVRDIEIVMEAEGFISGRVIDADTGKSVPELTITPMKWRTYSGTRALMFQADGASTDDEGKYELKGLPPGEYVLEIAPKIRERFHRDEAGGDFKRSVASSYVRSYYPGVERPEEAATLTLLPGRRLDGTDFKIAKRRAASIRGRVFADVDAETIGEVNVMLNMTQIQGTTRSFRSIARDKLRVGDSFIVDSLAPGTYYLFATARASDPKERRSGFTFFTVEDRNIDGVDVYLWRGATVRGRVVIEEPLLPLLEKDQSVRVSLSPQGRAGSASPAERPVDVSMPDGAFTLEGVPEGSFRPYVSGIPRTLAVGRVLYNGARVPRGVFTLNRGALEHTVDVVLARAAASVTVSVSDGGRPAADAHVVLLPEVFDDADPQLDAKAAISGRDGRATFANLLPGKYRLLAFPPGTPWRMGNILARNLPGGKELAVAEGGAETAEIRLITQP